MAKNIWPGIDMQQVFREGSIETNYVINKPLELPIKNGWMVIEDHFTLPQGITIEEAPDGEHLDNGYFRGNYLLRKSNGDTAFICQKPFYADGNAFGMPGMYKLLTNGSNYTLQLLVPVSFLNNKNNTYPLVIDPIEEGQTRRGEFTSQGTTNYFQYGFTSMALGSCDYSLTVDVPGKSTLIRAYADLEYALSYDNSCGSPPLPAPYCTFNQVTQQIVCDSCNTTTGPLTCNPSAPPYTGTCTTDSNLVPSAHSLLITSFVPDYLACYTPRCANYSIPFTLKNQDSICGDNCGYLCARGHIWIMTVEGETDSVGIVNYSMRVCGGEQATLTASATYGVPPYAYLWSTNGGHSFDTIMGTNQFVFSPSDTASVICEVSDGCSNLSLPDTITVYVSPAIKVSGDTLTASPGAGYQWYLNDTLIPDATQQQLIATSSGTYSVSVTGDTCRPSVSVNVIPAGIGSSALGGNKIAVVPNPTDGNFELHFAAVASVQNATLKILDDEGQIVLSKPVSVYQGPNVYPLQLGAKAAAGIYWVELQAGQKNFTQKFVVEK